MHDLLIGFTSLNYKDIIMYLIGLALIYLAIKKEYEPMLLLPIGFGAILVNMPLSVVWEYEGQAGFLKILFDAGHDLFRRGGAGRHLRHHADGRAVGL